MHLLARSSLLLAIPHLAIAFPALSPDAAKVVARLAEASPKQDKLSERAVGFDPSAQLVDVSGQYAWQAPNFAAGDQRGPCPGLNSLANHGYLPRNGIASWEDIATVTNKVFGLGEDIATFLAVYGAIFDGSIISLDPGYSIGGPSALNDNILGGAGLLGTPQGLSGSHNKYESDASAGRGDLYTDGNDYRLNITRFQMLYELQTDPATASYDLTVWSHHRKNMFELSLNENPYFFYAPFAGPIASTGGFTFPPRMMSNKSAEYPDNGILNQDVLKSFFSVNGTSGNLKYTFGWERIPANFYRRAIGNEYTAELFFDDFMMFASYFPEMASIGGNTGKTNSYAALSISNFTGGVYNSADLLQGNNLECFVFQSLLAGAPDILKGGYSDPSGPMATLTDRVNDFLGDTVCPQIAEPNYDQFNSYPGYKFGNTGSL